MPLVNILAILYGRSKVGKTLATLRAFPTGLFIAPRGALHCSSWLGWEPTSLEAGDKVGIPEITQVLKKKHTEFPAIIVDDLSILADQHLAMCKARYSGWSAFDVFNKDVYALRDAARAASCHVLLTMHEQSPKEVKKPGQKRMLPGSPLIPGWQLPEKLPALADVVARVVHQPDTTGWPYVYQVGPDEDYITGDRLSIFPEFFPLNLREAMLETGYDLPRPKELEWMEAAAEALSSGILEEMGKKTPAIKAYLHKALPSLRKRASDPRHIRWAIADALDRAQLRKHRANLVDDYVASITI